MAEEQPLDEFELFGAGNQQAEYMIRRNHRYLMLACVSFLMLNLVKMGVETFSPNLLGLTSGQNDFISMLFIVASIYYYYFLISYFKFYKLKKIIRITMVLLITDVISQLIYLVSKANYFDLKLIEGVNNLISLVFTIAWIVLIFRLSMHYAAIKSLKNSVMSLIIVLIVSMITPFAFLFFNYDALISYVNLVYIPLIIPYFFIIDFVLKLKVKEEQNFM